jgi:hypothetical protein
VNQLQHVVTLTPNEMCEYRRVALECATRIAPIDCEPAVVMHNAGCLLTFMLHGMPVQPAEVIRETKLPEDGNHPANGY